MLSLPNIDIWTCKLPNDLLQKIKEECFNYKNLKPHITGLTQDKSVPKHYLLETNKQALCDYIQEQLIKYESASEYLKSFTFTTAYTNLAFKEIWINIQKQNEFLPLHKHDGVYSFTSWINIPKCLNEKSAQGSFEFIYSDVLGRSRFIRVDLDKDMEGKILIFPSGLAHCVYPFTNSDETRISISGNIAFYTGEDKE
jgi:hypothetical protein